MAAPAKVTPGEYLAAERRASARHELHDGRVVAMAGASKEHNTVVANLSGLLYNALRDTGCRHFVADMRVAADRGRLYAYPDLTIFCGDGRFEDEQGDVLLNPVALIEVLSPATEAFDRGEKFMRYQAIAELTTYVLVSPDARRVETFTRQPDGRWLFERFEGDGVARLATPDVALPLERSVEGLPGSSSANA